MEGQYWFVQQAKSAAHPHEREERNLRFPNGKTYTYYRVPLWVFRGLLAAGSHGAYYNRYIAGRYGS